MIRLAAAALAAATCATALAAEDPPPAAPDYVALAAPGFERVLLSGNRLVRARVRSRDGGQALLEREDGLLVIARERSILRTLGPAEPFPAADADASLYLRDGRIVRRRMVLRVPGGAVVEAEDGARSFVPDDLLRLVRGPEAPLRLAVPPLVPGPLGVASRATVTIFPGRALEGTLLGRSEDALLVDLDGLGRVAILAEAVLALELAPGASPPPLARAERWPADPAAHRALALPTALLRRGGLLAGQTGLLTTLDTFPLPHLQLSIGTAWPAGYQRRSGWNALATVKAGVTLGKAVHLAAGAQAATADAGATAFAFAAATVGTPDANASVYVGPPLAGTFEAGRFEDRVLASSATLRLSPRFALLTEHWVGLSESPAPYAGAAGVRWIQGRLAVDLAVLRVPTASLPLAWLAASWALVPPREVKP